MHPRRRSLTVLLALIPVAALAAGIGYAIGFVMVEPHRSSHESLAATAHRLPDSKGTTADTAAADKNAQHGTSRAYISRRTADTSGFFQMAALVKPWPHNATLSQVGQAFKVTGFRVINEIDH